jgi:diphthamide synthase subunit DPH2
MTEETIPWVLGQNNGRNRANTLQKPLRRIKDSGKEVALIAYKARIASILHEFSNECKQALKKGVSDPTDL